MLSPFQMIEDSSLVTETTEIRKDVINDCKKLYDRLDNAEVTLNKAFHKKYLDFAYNRALPNQMNSLDSSQPWMLYWIGNSLKVMEREWLDEDYVIRIQEKLFASYFDGGPFGGGLGQFPHLASNYAAIEALALCQNIKECWDKINTKSIYDWFISLKLPSGSFMTASDVGEVDTRGLYTVLSVASLLGIMDDKLTKGCEDFLVNSQTYEGGFGSCPQEDEAHGGYTFCAIASLAILGSLHKINTKKLMAWCSACQKNEEKGLSGRSNKLVDGCYSFWIGATAAILEAYGYGQCIDKQSLNDYILKCCQFDHLSGLADKPGKRPDFYHTNYALMGLSVAQYQFNCEPNSVDVECSPIVAKPMVAPINPIYALPIQDQSLFKAHFQN